MEVWRQELYHHGIKGQKWGIRRYQNPDGSLTEAGRKRFRGSDDYAMARVLKRKGIENLTNDELRSLNERLQLERDYKQYTDKGESYTKKVLTETGAKVLSTVAVSALAYAGAKYMAKKYNITPENVAKATVDVTSRFATTLAKESAKAASAVAKESAKAASAAAKESAKAASAVVKDSAKAVSSKIKESAKTGNDIMESKLKDLRKSGRQGLKNLLGEEAYANAIRKARTNKRGGNSK